MVRLDRRVAARRESQYEGEGDDVSRPEPPYRRADEQGDADDAFRLGLLLEDQGELADAKQAYQSADPLGHAAAAGYLGLLLEEEGELAGAEAAYRRADALGDAAGAFNLGLLLEGQGKLTDAKLAFQRADVRGHAAAACNLGVLLEDQGERAGAEAAYRRADERDDAAGAFNLGGLLEERGELGDAKAAYTRAEQRGDSELAQMARAALVDLGIGIKTHPDNRDAHTRTKTRPSELPALTHHIYDQEDDVTDTTEIPRSPVIEAELAPNGRGEVTARVRLPDGDTPTLSAPELPQARAQVLDLVATYARDKVGHAVRLQVTDPDGLRLVGVGLDGTHVALDSHPSPADARGAGAEQPRAEMSVLDGGVPPASSVGLRPSPPSAPAPSLPVRGGLDRTRLHPLHRAPLARALDGWREGSKAAEQRQEEEADKRLARRYTLTDTNCIAVVSNKGGSGKTSISLLLGEALASRLPNQRVLAVDFNPGGGALGAAATEDRQAQFSLLELHADRAKIDRHSKLEPYVASLSSGLDLLAVPPDPVHALAITPEHYEQLFQELLAPNYNLILLDTSPDIMNPITQWALLHGTQAIIVTEQGYLSGKVVEHSLPYLLEQPASGENGRQATVVINKVLDDPRAGSTEETQRALREHHAGPVIRIPWDLDLRAQIDLGDYTLDQVRRRSTRLAIKQLAVEVTDRFI